MWFSIKMLQIPCEAGLRRSGLSGESGTVQTKVSIAYQPDLSRVVASLFYYLIISDSILYNCLRVRMTPVDHPFYCILDYLDGTVQLTQLRFGVLLILRDESWRVGSFLNSLKRTLADIPFVLSNRSRHLASQDSTLNNSYLISITWSGIRHPYSGIREQF